MSQPRVRILELGQLDLEPAFSRACVRGEDVQDQLAAVEDLAVRDDLEVPNLRGGQVVVEDDHVHFILVGAVADLLGLAGADVEAGVRLGALGDHLVHDVGAGGSRQAAKLPQRVPRIDVRFRQDHGHQQRTLPLDGQVGSLHFGHRLLLRPPHADSTDSLYRGLGDLEGECSASIACAEGPRAATRGRWWRTARGEEAWGG
jgi:hypothetical protein